MAKKLKKKIEDVCGISGLDTDARIAKATSILLDQEWKQKLCNSLDGLSFRDLERALKSIATERQVRPEKEKVYKSEKLKTYAGKKPNPSSTKSPSRSLEEILAQVHAPREDRAEGTYLQLRGSGHEDRETGEEHSFLQGWSDDNSEMDNT